MNLRLEQLLHELEVFQFRVSQVKTHAILMTILGPEAFTQLVASLDLVYNACLKLRKNPEFASSSQNETWIEESFTVLAHTRTSLKQALEKYGTSDIKL